MSKRKEKEIWKSFLAFLLAIPALFLISDGIKQCIKQLLLGYCPELLGCCPELASNPFSMVLIGAVWLLTIYVLFGYKKW